LGIPILRPHHQVYPITRYYTDATRPENRICFISKNLIRDFNDYIFIDMLISNENKDLFKFNFLTIDKNNIRRWDERDEFLEAIVALKNSEKWSDLDNFRYLDHLFYLISGKKSNKITIHYI
jgi:hypothetical protein